MQPLQGTKSKLNVQAVRENSLTGGNGDLDLDRDLQKFHK